MWILTLYLHGKCLRHKVAFLYVITIDQRLYQANTEQYKQL